MKKPKELFTADTKNLSNSELYFLIIKEIFNENEHDLKELLDKLGENKKKLEKFAHFYYFICQPFNDDINFREELRLIGMTSLIEGMMQEIEYKDFFKWFESTYKNNKIENYLKTKEEYLKQFGATKKIKIYFENYLSEEDKELLIKYIEPFENNKGFFHFDSISKIADFLYEMRSEFVHSAKMRHLCPKDYGSALIFVKKKPHKVNIHIGQLMEIFEKSFINFWREKAGINSTKTLAK